MQNPIQIRPLPGSSSEMYRKGDVVGVQWTGRDADRGKWYRGVVSNVPRLGSTRSGTIDFQYWAGHGYEEHVSCTRVRLIEMPSFTDDDDDEGVDVNVNRGGATRR